MGSRFLSDQVGLFTALAARVSERECSIVVNGAEDGTAVPEIAIRHAINDPHFILLSFLLPIHSQYKTETVLRQ